MFSMHNPLSDLCYKTTNVYRSNLNKIFFISDPPHLIKTIRNCFSRGKLWVSLKCHYAFICFMLYSCSVIDKKLIGIWLLSCTKGMPVPLLLHLVWVLCQSWSTNMFTSTNFPKWGLIWQLRYLTFISCCQCYNFKCTQVLSETASKALYFCRNEAAFETAYFIHKMDQFFECVIILPRKAEEKSVPAAIPQWKWF